MSVRPIWLQCLAIATTFAQEPIVNRCTAALERGNYADASRQAQTLVRLHPESVQARLLLARAYMGLNNASEALEQLRAALRRNPKSQDALYYTSKLTGLLSQQEFAFVLERAPDSARAHQLRAEAMEAQGNAPEAEREYLAALEKRPRTASVTNALGELMRHQKRYQDALQWYAKTLELDSGNYDALYGSGACYQLLEDSERAVPFYRRALVVEPSSIAAKMALGEVLVVTRHENEAIPLLEEAARSDPGFRRLQYLLGRAYQMAGRAEESRRAFDRMRALAERDSEIEAPAEEPK